jgi:hypothetical protein
MSRAPRLSRSTSQRIRCILLGRARYDPAICNAIVGVGSRLHLARGSKLPPAAPTAGWHDFCLPRCGFSTLAMIFRHHSTKWGQLAVEAAFVAAASTTLLAGCSGREGKAIRDLPQRDREALYGRTLETLRTVCSNSRGDSLSDFCQAQAKFVSEFPECDPGCQELAGTFWPRPTR